MKSPNSNIFAMRGLFCSWNSQLVNKWQSLFEQFVHSRKVCNQQQAGISSPRRLITIYKVINTSKTFVLWRLSGKSLEEKYDEVTFQQMASQQRSLQISKWHLNREVCKSKLPIKWHLPVHPGEMFGEEPYRSFSLVEISVHRLTSPHLSADLR